MMNQELVSEISRIEAELRTELRFVSDFIYKNPELGMEEYLACQLLCNVAESHGFCVTRPFCDLETAFLAEFRNGPGPTIAFLAEYDALPGFGPEGKPGHASGHNWTAATTLGTVLVLSKMKESFKGTIQLIGTPGMENYGAKVDMVQKHIFDEVDAVMQPQLERYTSLNCRSLALDAIQFDFKGRAAHAAVYAEEGINALDALQFTFMGISGLKNHLRKDVNIHGIIVDGGEIPSVIPAHASGRFYVRAVSRAYLDSVTRKVIRCAEGAALMAGAEMSFHHFENSSDDLINSAVLREILWEYMQLEGLEVTHEYKKDDTSLGAADIGNVSHVCPTIYAEFDMEAPDEFQIHSKTAMKYVNSELGGRKMDQVIRILVGSALELFHNPQKIEAAKLSFRRDLRGQGL